MKLIICAFVIALAAIVAGDDNDLDLDLPPVNSHPFNLQGLFDNLPINASSLPSHEEAEGLLREKCMEAGGREAYDKNVEARDTLLKCVTPLVNTTELMIQIEKAKPTGDLDTVFRQYCRKTPILKRCILTFVNDTKDCMSEEEKQHTGIVRDLMDQFLSFVCHKEGDRIALFIAEKGPECLSDKQEAIFHCVNSTVSKHMSSGMMGLAYLLDNAKDCGDVCSLQNCVVNSLETCKEPTPANIVQAVFKHVLKVTKCRCPDTPSLSRLRASSGRVVPTSVCTAVSIMLSQILL